MGLTNLAHVLLAERDARAAVRALKESLALLGELGHEYGEAVCVSALAAIALAQAQAGLAARLLGAADAALQRLRNSLEPPDLRAYERTLIGAREALGDRFGDEFERGQRLTLAEAVELAGPLERVLAAPAEANGTAAPRASEMPRLGDRARPSSPEASRAQPRALNGDAAPGDLDVLTPREREVAALIARGYTSDAIADALIMTTRTADTHAAHIRVKLGLRSRAQIAAWAIQHGLA
jgi:non-specific serine/threonine protein kinase